MTIPYHDAAAIGQVQAWQIAKRRSRMAHQWIGCSIVLVVFGTALSPFILSDQRNVLVILVAALALPAIIMLRLPIGGDVGWSTAVTVYLLVAEMINGGVANFSSLGYTGMFVLAYIAFCGTLQAGAVTRDQLMALLRRLIQAYFLVSVIQLVFDKVGLPVPNHILSKEAWSYNTLGVEPSHSARSLAFTLLAYLILARRDGPAPSVAQLWRAEKPTLVAFTISLILTGSSLAVAILPLTIVMALRLRWVAVGCVVLVFAWPYLQTVEIESIRRVIAFLTALPSMDIMSMVQADHSAALRVMPLIIFMQTATLSDPSVWFGGGYDDITHYIQGHLVGVAKDVAAAGFIPGYVMICGIVGAALFCHAYLFRFLNRQTLPLILLWIPILANCAWNSQIFWYSLALLRAVHYFSQLPSSSGHPVAARVRR
jgi:hypothetical protein